MLRMTAAAEQDRRQDLHEPKTRAASAYQQIDPTLYPNITTVQHHVVTGGRPRIAWAITAILAGLKPRSVDLPG